MNDNRYSIKLGGGFFNLLTILFVGLKLTNYITWSWLWVLSPLWIPLVVFLSFLVVFLVGAFIITRWG